MEQHIVKRFDEELSELKHNMLEMGRSVRRQLDAVGLVLLKLDHREASEIEAADVDINRQEKDLDAFIECILSSRQPQAVDLRMLLGCLRMTIDFERMGDEVRNAAKGVRKMSSSLEGQLLTTCDALLTIHAHLLVMTTEALLAVEDIDVEKARAVLARQPVVVSEVHAAVVALVEHLKEGHTDVPDGLELIRIAKSLERVGAHLTNVAEAIVFVREGVDIRHQTSTQA